MAAEEDYEKPRSIWPALIGLGLIFIPGAIVAFTLWSLFRYGRNKPSVINAAAGLVSVLAIALGFIAVSSLSGLFSDLKNFDQYITPLVLTWVSLSVLIGAPLGAVFVVVEARRMKKNPYLTELSGTWRYKFQYKRTPLEYFSRKKKIQQLKNGLLVEDSKAPMGLDEATDEVVFRYDTEARKHTFMTGASGSGKALHSDTLIPTRRGMVKAGRVRIGDYLFDENGKETKVTAKFQPMTKDHYELRLSNGEVVKACGDHLWGVRESNSSLAMKTVSTREIAKDPSKYFISSLKKSIESIEKSQINTKLFGEWLATGASVQELSLSQDQQVRQTESERGAFTHDLQRMGWLSELGLKFNYNYLTTEESSRIKVLSSAITKAGSYLVDGQTKLTIPNEEAAEFLRSLVFSLGMQASKLENSENSAFSFKFKDRNVKRKVGGTFSKSIGEINRRKAPLRTAIQFESVVEIEDNPEDYFCFTVDSPSHLFLFGKTFTPTHNTITMQSLISADIDNGKTVVVIDFKRSPKFAAKLAAWSADNDREFYHFMNGDVEEYDIPRSKGQCYYDPLKSGTPTSKADMVLGMREYDSNAAVYKAAMQQLLQVLFSMLKFADKKSAKGIDWTHGGMNQLASVMSGNGLGELASACSIEVPPGTTQWTYTKPGSSGIAGGQEVYMNTPIAKNAIELAEAMRAKGPLNQAKDELQGQMRTIMASEYGKWMTTGNTSEDREIDLFKLTKEEGNVILFSLNSDSEPEFAQYVGSMIFADLTNISALRRNAGSDNQVNIYVDEFQAVPPTAVTALLEKSRESKMALTIAQQSFDQVVASADKAGEAYLLSILDTCSNFIAHAGATEDSAVRLSKILGKEYVTVFSKTNDDDSSFMSRNNRRSIDSKVAAREEERWKFPPSSFMKLSSPDPANGFKSSAVWVTKTSADPKYAMKGGATAREVWMIPAEQVLVEYYTGAQEERPKRSIAKKVESANSEFTPSQSGGSIDDLDFDDVNNVVEEDHYIVPESDFHDEHYEDEADIDEDWGMVEIPDEAPAYDDYEDESLPPSVEESFIPKKETVYVEDSVEDLFKSGPPQALPEVKAPSKAERVEKAPARALPVEHELPSLPKRPQAGGLPKRPGGGLPMSRPGAGVNKTPVKNSDLKLPNIDDIELPDL